MTRRGFCELIGICTEKLDPVPEPPVSDDMECDFCKQLVTYLKTWITANTTHEEFQVIVQNLCKKLAKGKYEQQCLSFFNQYGEEDSSIDH